MNDKITVSWTRLAFYLYLILPLILFLILMFVFVQTHQNFYGYLFLFLWVIFLWFISYPVITYNPPIIIEDNGFYYLHQYLSWNDIEIFRLRKIFHHKVNTYCVGFILSGPGYQKLNSNNPLWFRIFRINNFIHSFLGLKNENEKYILFPRALDINQRDLLQILNEKHNK